MNITVDRQPGCIGILRAEVPADDVRSERAKIVQTFAKQARIQGFRPGKAPQAVIEKRFGSQIRDELHERLTRRAFDQALKKDEVRVLDLGEPTAMEETPDGSFAFESRMIMAPEVELPTYKGLTLRLPPAELSEDELNQQLEGIRQRFADYQDIEDRTAETGDLVVIDYHSTLDGKPLEEALGKPAGYLGGREGFWLRLDPESFLPGFADQLLETRPGDQKTVTVTIPDDFPVAELRGREPVFEVTVKELKSMELPDLDDAFAEKVGMESFEKLKEVVAEQSTIEKTRRIEEAEQNQVIEQLTSQVDFELPEALLQQEIQGQADAMVQRGIEGGMDEEAIAAQQEEIFASASVRARNQLKANFILQQIAEAEALEVSDSEVVSRLLEIAQAENQDPKKFIQQMQKTDRIAGIRHSLRLAKAIDFVVEHATVEEVQPSPQEPTS